LPEDETSGVVGRVEKADFSTSLRSGRNDGVFVGSRAWLKEWLSRGQVLKAGAKTKTDPPPSAKDDNKNAEARCKLHEQKQRRIGGLR
jgi:hypothetical protein